MEYACVHLKLNTYLLYLVPSGANDARKTMRVLANTLKDEHQNLGAIVRLR